MDCIVAIECNVSNKIGNFRNRLHIHTYTEVHRGSQVVESIKPQITVKPVNSALRGQNINRHPYLSLDLLFHVVGVRC